MLDAHNDAEMLTAARGYIAAGISVIPIEANGKRPALPAWKEYQSRHATEAELVEWFDKKQRNIGIVTGAISGFTVVDFDTAAAIADAKVKGFPRGPLSQTAKGFHALCRYEDGHRNFQKRADLPGVDLRGDGGYIVAPPSIHASGAKYQWAKGRGLTDLALPALPGWIMAKSSTGKPTMEELHTTTPEGRNISLTRLAGVWLNQHKDIDLAGLIEIATEWNKGIDPLPMEEVKRTCQSIFDRYNNSPSPDQWSEPLPIESQIEPADYPLDALPEIIRLAVDEVLGFVKAPAPLVISAALSALSMAIQAHADVERAVKLSGPSSLFLLTIAESGERKSTCDSFFTSAIRDYQAEQAEAAKPDIKRHESELTAWEAKTGGVKDSIRQAAKIGESTTDKEAELLQLQIDKPQRPRVPRIIYGDATPEALKYSLAKEWPSGAVVASEAGVVFGSHGMGKDSAMRNLATLNQLWDGTDMPTERRSSESYTVKGARLTMSLMVQEATLRAFFKQDGGLARGTGFLARFLIAWPDSTQGYRPFTDAPENWPHLAAFNRRIAEILRQPPPIQSDGSLTPVMLPLSPEAKAAWIDFHDAIESELATGGELFDIRDVASKTADNAARLACLFQVFTHGGGAITLKAIESSSMITAWHLNEARRFFGGLALPQDIADAARLDSWLVNHCRRERTDLVTTRTIQQFGPHGIRAKTAIDEAVKELEGLDRIRLVKDGKRRAIQVNPRLLERVA